MPKMQVHRDWPGEVVLGPCPGCELWTLEYDVAARSQWSGAGFADVVEALLAEHLADCPGLREIVATR